MANISSDSFMNGPTDLPSTTEVISSTVLACLENVSLADIFPNATLCPDKSNGTNTLTVIDRSWIYYGIGPFICMFGIVCNIVNLCVLLQRCLNEAPYSYLTALATFDLAFLTISFVHLILSKAEPTYGKAFLDVYIFFSFGNACFNSSVWVTVVMTLERVLFVKNPLKFRPSRKWARIRVVIIFIVSCIINTPRLFCYTIIEYKGGQYPFGQPFRESQTFFQISWFHAVLVNFLPLIILIAANCYLIVTLHKAGKQRASLRMNQEEASRRDQTRLTRTLVAIVIVFFFCTIPSAFVEDPIAYTLFGEDKTWSQYLKSPANQTFIYISNLLLFLNSGLNFLLYCAFNKRFRQAMTSCCRKLNPKCSRGRVENTSTYKYGTSPSPVTSRFTLTMSEERKVDTNCDTHESCRL